MSWQTEKIRGKWRPFELSQRLLWGSSGPIKLETEWGEKDFPRGRRQLTSVYRFAHQDNDYVIAIVAGIQRRKGKDEGLMLIRKDTDTRYKELTPCIVVLVERYIKD